MSDSDTRVAASVQVTEANSSTVIGVQYQFNDLSAVREEVQKLIREQSGLERRQDANDIFMAPPLPSQHVRRGLLLTVLAEKVLAIADHGVLRAEILHGVGGIGKSTLAKALCHEPQIRNSF